MKRTFLLLFVALMKGSMIFAQVNPSVDEGYVFVTNLKSYSKKSLKSKALSTISAGHVAIIDENNSLNFHLIEASESITLGNGAFHEYYPPAQDDVPAEYISSAAFKKAVRKVSISKQMPTTWELGKVYSFKPFSPNADYQSITVRPLRLSSNNVTLVTMKDEDFQPTSSINISGEIIVEIAFDNNKVYLYNGQQVVLETNDSDENGYSSLVVDDKGITYSQNEKGVRQPNNKLSYVFGEYPELDYFGWISNTEIVIDNSLYVTTSTSS